MAVNPQIALGVKPAQINHPSAVLGDVLKARDAEETRRKKLEDETKAKLEEDTVAAAFQANRRPDGTPDYNGIVNYVSRTHPTRAMALREQFDKSLGAGATSKSLMIKATRDAIAADTAWLNEMTPETFIPTLARLQDPGVREFIGNTWDPVLTPQKIKQAIAMGRTEDERQRAYEASLKMALSGDVERAVGNLARFATQKSHWDDAISFGRAHGMSEAAVSALGSFDEKAPEAARARAAQFALTENERLQHVDREATNARQKAADEALKADREADNALNRDRFNREKTAGATADRVSLRQAQMWRARETSDLAKRKREAIANQEPMSPEAIQEEEDRIESSFTEMTGGTAPETPAPKGASRTAALESLTSPTVTPVGGQPGRSGYQSVVKPTFKVGQPVKRGGKSYRVTQVFPDGTVDIEPIK